MQLTIPTILDNLDIKALNEMQEASLEANRGAGDYILLANTGSGKTLGFLLPILERLDADNAATQALVIAPSRELAQQIEQVFKKMSTGFKVTCCYGGHLRETEENNLLEAPALIIGTPGRLGDHLRRGNIKPNQIHTLVLDEFDKSLELGFQEEMAFVIGELPALEKRILTSATDSAAIPAFVGMREPVKLNYLTGESAEALTLQYARSGEKDKIDLLAQLICQLGTRLTIVFCNHRDAVERTSTLLKEKGIVNVFYHGAMEQREREAALSKFRNGSAVVLVTTDLAARGLDIPYIRYIIHYHLPATEAVFTHRNGRTARMEASGTAILLLGPGEKLPDFITADIEELEVDATCPLPEKPKWTTVFIGAGKKDKVNKVDIVGFLIQKGSLKKDDVGLIEVKDFFSFVAVRKSKLSHALNLVQGQKLKNKKVKIEIAK